MVDLEGIDLTRIVVSKPFGIRRYPGSGTYYCRYISQDGRQVLYWQDWAQFWAQDLKRLKAGKTAGTSFQALCPKCGEVIYRKGHNCS